MAWQAENPVRAVAPCTSPTTTQRKFRERAVCSQKKETASALKRPAEEVGDTNRNSCSRRAGTLEVLEVSCALFRCSYNGVVSSGPDTRLAKAANQPDADPFSSSSNIPNGPSRRPWVIVAGMLFMLLAFATTGSA